MPVIGSRAAAGIRSFGLFVLAGLKTVIDTFNRSNSSSLGDVSGQTWKVWRGTWSISSNRASATSPASSYPAATLNFMSTDVTLGVASPDPGAGTVFWLSDSDNWWAATYDSIYSCQTCQGYSCTAYSVVCNASTCNAYTCTAYTCNAFTLGSCTAWAGWNCIAWNAGANPANRNCSARNPAFCNGRNPATCNSRSCSSGSCSSSTCNSSSTFCNSGFTFFFSCNCSTTYRTNLIKDVAGTISTVANSTWSAVVGSFKVILSGSNVTVRAYNTASYTSQIGSDWTTSVTATKNKKHGIIVSPANYAQGNTIDEFRVE